MSEQALDKKKTAEEVMPGPDLSWRSLYRAGGVSAFLYILLGMIVPALLYIPSDFHSITSGAATLQYITSHRAWWIIIQTLTLAPSFLAIVVFAALFMALKHLNKGYAAIGTLVAVVCQILFLAYLPVVFGLVYLSDQYAAAATEAQRLTFAVAAEGLNAQNFAFSPSETAFAIGVLIISLVMLKGVFHKAVAYLGIATFSACIICEPLRPIIGTKYLFWWTFFMIWFVAVGFKLYKLGSRKTIK